MNITKKYLQNKYNYRDGNLFYKQSTGNRAAGDMVGTSDENNYVRARIDYRKYQLHRLIWIYHYDKIPAKKQIDHINNNLRDNRIENLRLASHAQNMRNSKIRIQNKSGIKGVSWHSKMEKYQACISLNYKSYHLGYYDTKEEAAVAYARAAKKYHGDFAKL